MRWRRRARSVGGKRRGQARVPERWWRWRQRRGTSFRGWRAHCGRPTVWWMQVWGWAWVPWRLWRRRRWQRRARWHGRRRAWRGRTWRRWRFGLAEVHVIGHSHLCSFLLFADGQAGQRRPCALTPVATTRRAWHDRGWRAHCQSRLSHRASTRCTTAVHSTGVGGAAQLEEADGAHTRRGWHGRGLDRIVWLVRSECRQRNIIAPVGRALGRPLYIDCNCLNSKVLSQLGLDDSHHVHHALRQWYRHRRLVEPWYPAGYV